MTAVATFLNEDFTGIVSDCIVLTSGKIYGSGNYRVIDKLESLTDKTHYFAFIGDELVREALHCINFWAELRNHQLHFDSKYIDDLTECVNYFKEANANVGHPHAMQNTTIYVVNQGSVSRWHIGYNSKNNCFFNKQLPPINLSKGKIELNYGSQLSYPQLNTTPKTCKEVYDLLKNEIEQKHIQMKSAGSALNYDFGGYFSGAVYQRGVPKPEFFYPFNILSDAIYGNYGDTKNINLITNSKRKWNPF
jgi:hypothetical protein